MTNSALDSPTHLEDSGLMDRRYPMPLEHYQREARKLANLWANGNAGARTCILVALLKAAQGANADTRPSESAGFQPPAVFTDPIASTPTAGFGEPVAWVDPRELKSLIEQGFSANIYRTQSVPYRVPLYTPPVAPPSVDSGDVREVLAFARAALVTIRAAHGYSAVGAEAINRINNALSQSPATLGAMPDAHELFAAAQLLPGEGVEDAVARILSLFPTDRMPL